MNVRAFTVDGMQAGSSGARLQLLPEQPGALAEAWDHVPSSGDPSVLVALAVPGVVSPVIVAGVDQCVSEVLDVRAIGWAVAAAGEQRGGACNVRRRQGIVLVDPTGVASQAARSTVEVGQREGWVAAFREQRDLRKCCYIPLTSSYATTNSPDAY